MNPQAQQDIHAATGSEGVAVAAAKVISKIKSHPRMRMISVGAIDTADKLDGTIYVDEKLYKIQVQILSGASSSSTSSVYTSTFTILCGLDPSGGVAITNGWQYTLPHPYASHEYMVTVINNSTEQEQHVDIRKTSTSTIFETAVKPTVCHDVTFVGHVGV